MNLRKGSATNYDPTVTAVGTLMGHFAQLPSSHEPVVGVSRLFGTESKR
jgi:hypothetical protein